MSIVQPDNDPPSWVNTIESCNPDELAPGQTGTQYPCEQTPVARQYTTGLSEQNLGDSDLFTD